MELVLLLVLMIFPTPVRLIVCLKGEIKNDSLIMKCKVDELVFDVFITDPAGKDVGKCIAPVRDYGWNGSCLTNDTIQDLKSNITTVVLNEIETRNISGWWTCSHGSNQGIDTFFVSNLCLTKKVLKDKHSNNCVVWQIILFCFLAVVGVLVTGSKLKLWTSIYNLTWTLCRGITVVGGKRNDTLDQEQLLEGQSAETVYHSLCSTCNHLTAFAFCSDCNGFHCESCYEHHKTISPKHNLLQIEHIAVSNHNARCTECDKNISTSVCVTCRKLFCKACSCKHDHKSLLLKPHATTIGCPQCRNLIGDDMEKKGMIRLPADKLPTRICGIAFLLENMFILADSNNRKLKIFQNYDYLYFKNLTAEPRGMTGVYDSKIAVTFPHKREIRIFDIAIEDVYDDEKIINFSNIGKPFSIAYNREIFAVEVGEEDAGSIIILSLDGVVIKRIDTAIKYAYFTGHTVRLALDKANECVYISAMSKRSISCLGFDGHSRWTVQFPSPRGICFVQAQNLKNTNLLVASKKGNAVYELVGSSGKRFTVASNGEIVSPRYIAFNPAGKTLYIQVNSRDEDDAIIVYKYDIGSARV